MVRMPKYQNMQMSLTRLPYRQEDKTKDISNPILRLPSYFYDVKSKPL